MRGPPPQRIPPVPPPDGTIDDDDLRISNGDDSQYDEPGVPAATMRYYCDDPTTTKRHSKLINNNYEISTSQQNRCSSSRSAQMSYLQSTDDESRRMLLQNPDTGSYYVPTSSERSIVTSLSPNSRFYEKSLFASCTSSANGSSSLHLKEQHLVRPNVRLKHQLRHQQHHLQNQQQYLTTEKQPVCGQLMDNKKHQKSFCTWRKLALLLFFLLALTCFIILLLSRGRDHPLQKCIHLGKPVFSSASGLYSDVKRDTEVELKPLPDQFELGTVIDGQLPPGILTYTQFSLQYDSSVTVNISIGAQARIVIYGRRTALPSPSLNDFSDIVLADRLTSGANRSKRFSPVLFRSAIITHFLLAGRWHIGLLNDAEQPEYVQLHASVAADRGSRERNEDCRYDCTGHGECKDGQCHCFRGYTGTYCEENSCPILCSGNGILTGGRCLCHEGFKGADCDLLSHWCEIPNCNGHGTCNQLGFCDCDTGWKGQFCDEKNCVDARCNDHGVCVNGSCFCANGFSGENCEILITESQCDTEKSERNKKSKSEDSGADLACTSRGRVDPELDQCICLPGYHGKKCELARCEVECINGACGDGHCICREGWSGIACTDLECLPGCEEHGVCNNGTCVCNKGWNGENCYIVGCVNNCHGSGVCQQFSGQWKCACDTTSFGSNCSLPIESNCEDGIDNDNDGLIDCQDSECCLDRSCSSSQLCTTVKQPRDVLLKLLPTVNANFYQQIKFLIQKDSVQLFADEVQFNQSIASVIRGRVLTENGSPVTGVRVAEARNPASTGFTLSRSEDNGGAFDLLVNGGRTVTLQFMRKPFEKLEKSFYVPWNEVVYVGDVQMRLGGSLPSTIDERPEISESCRQLSNTHRFNPTVFASYKVTQFSGHPVDSSASVQLLADAAKAYDSIKIFGTNDLHLIYDSSFASGHQSALLIELLPRKVPYELRLVHLIVTIAGNYFRTVFSARPSLSYTYAWDQTNIYAQTMSGLVNAKISIGYEYKKCNTSISWYHRLVRLEGRRANRFLLGGWSLNVHHHYDIVNNVLEKGDGARIYMSEVSPLLSTVVGGDQQRPINCPFCSTTVSDARLFRPDALCLGSDGSLYIGDYNLIRRLTPTGQLITILELSIADTVHPYYMAVNPVNDQLYLSLPIRAQIWQVNVAFDAKRDGGSGDLSANYNVLVGDGGVCASDVTGGRSCGDGGPADAAQLTYPKGITFDEQGNLFIADGRRIRVVGKDNRINTFISERNFGPRPCIVDFADLSSLSLNWPTSLAVDLLSNELIALDSNVIYRISLDTNSVILVAGTIDGCDQLKGADGEERRQIRALRDARGIAVSSDSTIYVVQSNGKKHNQIRAIYADGRSKVVVGKSSKCDCERVNCPCESPSPTVGTSAFLHSPSAIAVDCFGVVYIADQGNYKIKKLQAMSAKYDDKMNQYRIVSPQTNEVYTFNKNGLHTSTIGLLSAETILNFTYNVDTQLARLTQITGAGEFALRLRRISDAETILETAIGHRTRLVFDIFDGTLTEVSLPNGDTIKFSYFPGQLLRCKESDQRSWCFEYDEFGRVIGLFTPSGTHLSTRSRQFDHSIYQTNVTIDGMSLLTYSMEDKKFAESGVQKRLASILDDDGLLLFDSSGARIFFDGVSHPLLERHETAMLKRKITLPEANELADTSTRELNLRYDWRSYIRRREAPQRRGDNLRHVQQVGRRPRVNGRNVFTIEYNRDRRVDTLRDSADDDLLLITYNDAGQIISLMPVGETTRQLASLGVQYDVHGRQKMLIWGNVSLVNEFDRQSRLLSSHFSALGKNFLQRKFTYQKEAQLVPSSIELPSKERYRWHLDRWGNIVLLKTPIGGVHQFTRYAMFDRIYLRRQTPFANASFTTCINDDGQLLEYTTPDQMHLLAIQRDPAGRVTQISADAENIFFTRQLINDVIQISEVVTDSLKRTYKWQSVLAVAVREEYTTILHSNRRFSERLIEFVHEYDDLFRRSATSVIDNGVKLYTNRVQYDLRNGRVIKVDNFTILRDGNVRRIMGENMVLEVVKNEYDEETARKLIVNEQNVVELYLKRHSLGWIEVAEWTIAGNRRPNEYRTFNIDGQLVQFTFGESDEHRWTLHYDLDGRLKAINDAKVVLADNHLKSFDQTEYKLDANGWTIQRGDVHFEFDVFGRIRRVYRPDVLDIEYGYDEMSRLIWRRSGDQQLLRFLYAFPDRPNLLTHFTSPADESLCAILYDEHDVPFAVQSASNFHAIVTDFDGSVRYIFAADGKLIRELTRNPFGAVIGDTNPQFFIPLGFLAEFEDAEVGLAIIGPEARPYDTLIGRFMSTPPSFSTAAAIDVFQPEITADPFRLTPNKAASPVRHVPVAISEWLELSGIALNDVLPLLQPQHEQQHKLTVVNQLSDRDQLFKLPTNWCDNRYGSSIRHVQSAAFCSLSTQTKHFMQFLSVQPTVLVDEHPSVGKVAYGIGDSVGFRGILFRKLSDTKISAIGQSLTDEESVNALNAIFNQSSLVKNSNGWKLLESEFVLEDDIANTIRQQRMEIRRKTIWHDEAVRARSGSRTRHPWTHSELSVLRLNGIVTDYKVKFKPRKALPLIANSYLWTFERT